MIGSLLKGLFLALGRFLRYHVTGTLGRHKTPELRPSPPMCKELLEHMHAHYRSTSPTEFMTDKASNRPSATVQVPLSTALISEIRVFDSTVAIYKARREYVPYHSRNAET